MIEATQKKLREARFFVRLLNRESREAVRNELEAFEFYLNAFLSAARSVTFALQYEEKNKYDAWFQTWFNNRIEEDRQLLNFLRDQRNYAEKRGGADVNVILEYVPITEVRTDDRGHPAYGFHWFGPPGTTPPRVGLPVHSFGLSGDQKKVTSVCEQYVTILSELVRDFTDVHSQG